MIWRSLTGILVSLINASAKMLPFNKIFLLSFLVTSQAPHKNISDFYSSGCIFPKISILYK